MTYQYPDLIIIVFCKAPIAGQVKTRLIPELTAEQAVELHKELTHRTLSLVTSTNLCTVQLWCSPDSDHTFFSECQQQYPVSLHSQSGSDLGERMFNAISTALKSSSQVILIGCDSPSLKQTDFYDAIHALQTGSNIIIAPAEDGGYVMIGMSKSYPSLFLNKTWGHSDVYKISCQQVVNKGLKLTEIRWQWDVDTYSDVCRYRKFITKERLKNS